MSNLSLFAHGFLSYLICFAVFSLVIVVAVFIGIAIRKNKNKKEELVVEAPSSEAQ